MTGDVGDPIEAEFDTVAEWTAQVAAELGPEYLIPAACRGSGQPAALDWLLAGLRPRLGEIMVDVGAGIGGPAAFAADRTGARLVLVEPEPGACRAAVRLVDAPVIRADATALPFAAGAVALAWSLGVLCIAPGPEAQLDMLLQMRRVVRPGGRIGLLVYLAMVPELDDPPRGNHFPTSTDLNSMIRRARLDVLAVADSRDMPEPPAGWQRRTAAVERELRRRFGHTPQFAAATGQSDRIGHLLEVGQLTSQVILLSRE
jgi:SAM-dependent methyltransferase